MAQAVGGSVARNRGDGFGTQDPVDAPRIKARVFQAQLHQLDFVGAGSSAGRGKQLGRSLFDRGRGYERLKQRALERAPWRRAPAAREFYSAGPKVAGNFSPSRSPTERRATATAGLPSPADKAVRPDLHPLIVKKNHGAQSGLISTGLVTGAGASWGRAPQRASTAASSSIFTGLLT